MAKQQLHGGQNRHDQCAALREPTSESQRGKHDDGQCHGQHSVGLNWVIADRHHLQLVACRGTEHRDQRHGDENIRQQIMPFGPLCEAGHPIRLTDISLVERFGAYRIQEFP